MRLRILAGAAALALAVPAYSQKLPSTLTFTAYDTGSSGFNIAVAVGKTLKDKHGTDVRVLPAGNDVARLAPMAKLFACQTFRDVTAMCQQVWGGVGFTVEYDIQLYFRRAKQLQLSWWDTRYLEELVASSVLDGQEPGGE